VKKEVSSVRAMGIGNGIDQTSDVRIRPNSLARILAS
jgi:hypothetical protein